VTISSYEVKPLWDSQLSRMNCQTFSTGCSSGDFGGKGYDGDVGWDDEHACHMRTGTVENEDGMSPPVPLGMRFHQGAIYITCVLQRGRTRPAPTPRSRQMAPNFEADFVRWSFSALGRVPRRAQRGVSLVFCPTFASSCHQCSIVVPTGSPVRSPSSLEGEFL